MEQPRTRSLVQASPRRGTYHDATPDSRDVEEAPLLQDGEPESQTSVRPAPQRRRSAWPFALMLAMIMVAAVRLAGPLLSLDQTTKPHAEKPAENGGHLMPPKPHSKPHRPDDKYILDPTWDFSAPAQVREYEFTITDGEGNPDGVHRKMMLINGEFPGPLIEMNEGDELSVKVVNKASNATAIHWHGIYQNGTNWMDGAAGVTQCPIVPGRSFEYRFNVTGQSGTYFYHGHQGVQSLDGIVGPMVVHIRKEGGRPRVPYSSDRVILLQDWYYDQASAIMRDALSPGVEDAPTPNTALMNGVNRAVCSDHPGRNCSEVKRASLPRLSVIPGENHKLRFINAGGYAWFQVAVDKHNDLQIVEVDGTVVEPAQGSPLLISPGQRYSAVLKADQGDGSFWMRARMVTSCFAEQKLPENGIDEARAVVRYTKTLGSRHGDHEDNNDDDEDDNDNDGDGHNGEMDDDLKDLGLPETTSDLPFLPTCHDLNLTTPLRPSPAQPAPQFSDHSWYFRVNLAIGDWRLMRGVMNASSFRPNLKYPTLHRVLDGLAEENESYAMDGVNVAAFDEKSELVISSKKIETVDVILQNMDEKSHPFHLHGTRMWVLGAGHGYFPGYEALGFNAEGKGLLDPKNDTVLSNPLKRDTITAEGFGWVLLRFVADNPGVWLFHCHVVWHSEAGMGIQFLSRIDDLRGVKVPDEARKLCEAPEDELRKGAPPKDEVFFGFGNE
ncbi:multicopper oxidase [Xylariaceae sp. FL0594]|nr:multicopper oxidase [Xylariaceae sp. FL0594]